jgi:hypothetical protein
MKAMVIHELLNGNFLLEKTGIEISRTVLELLKTQYPKNTWLIFKLVKKEDCTNPSFDWDGYYKYQAEFEKFLKSRLPPKLTIITTNGPNDN